MSNNFDLSTFNDIAEESKLRVKAMESPAGSYLGNYDPKTILKNPAFLNDLRDVYASQGKFFNSDSDLVDNFFNVPVFIMSPLDRIFLPLLLHIFPLITAKMFGTEQQDNNFH